MHLGRVIRGRRCILETARLMVGTLQYAYGANVGDLLNVQLGLEP